MAFLLGKGPLTYYSPFSLAIYSLPQGPQLPDLKNLAYILPSLQEKKQLKRTGQGEARWDFRRIQPGQSLRRNQHWS